MSSDGWLFSFNVIVYLKDLEVFAEQSNEQPTSVLANMAAMAHSPTSLTTTSAATTTTAPVATSAIPTAATTTSIPSATSVKPTDGLSTTTQQHDAAAVVALAHNTEQSLASTKEKSTPEKVSLCVCL